jgi:hypothetical protein
MRRLSALATTLVVIVLSVPAFCQTSKDKLALTYFFYWYNVHTGEGFGNVPGQNGTTTLHPPDSYVATAPASLIQNGSFESTLAGAWQFGVQLGASATLSRDNSTDTDQGYSAVVTVTTAATTSPFFTGVQLWQPALSVEQGQVYRLQFRAKSDSARTMRLALGQNGGSFATYGLSTAFALGTAWQQYTLYFQSTATDPAARLNFYFGDQTGSTWLDGVDLRSASQ